MDMAKLDWFGSPPLVMVREPQSDTYYVGSVCAYIEFVGVGAVVAAIATVRPCHVLI